MVFVSGAARAVDAWLADPGISSLVVRALGVQLVGCAPMGAVLAEGVLIGGGVLAGGVPTGGVLTGGVLTGGVAVSPDDALSGCGLLGLSCLSNLMGDESGVVCRRGLDWGDAAESRRRKGELRMELPWLKGDGLYPGVAWKGSVVSLGRAGGAGMGIPFSCLLSSSW